MTALKFKRTETRAHGTTDNGIYLDGAVVRIVDKAKRRNPSEFDDPDDHDVWRVQFGDHIHEIDGCDLSPHPEAPATNEELVAFHFQWSRYGAMGQAFVMEAILKYASQVMLMSYEERAAMEKGFIHPDLWQACAREALEFYGRRDQ